jgi:hypothetical protein
MRDIEKRARELLAAEYRKSGHIALADMLGSENERAILLDRCALRAIIAALTPIEGCTLAAAAQAALPFIAYAFAQGVDGAEQAGRAVEAALQGNQPEGYVLVPVKHARSNVTVRAAVAGDLNNYLVAGAVHTLESISRLDQGPVRGKLIATLARQVRSLKRNEDRIRAAKRAEVSGG